MSPHIYYILMSYHILIGTLAHLLFRIFLFIYEIYTISVRLT